MDKVTEIILDQSENNQAAVVDLEPRDHCLQLTCLKSLTPAAAYVIYSPYTHLTAGWFLSVLRFLLKIFLFLLL